MLLFFGIISVKSASLGGLARDQRYQTQFKILVELPVMINYQKEAVWISAKQTLWPAGCAFLASC